jgi:hypothetical protein
MKQIIYFLLLLLVLTACKNEAKTETAAVETADAMALEAPLGDKAVKEKLTDAAYPSQKIIKNADLRFETDNLKITGERIQAAVRKYRAQVQQDSEGKDDYSVNRTIIIRIPGNNFEAFINDIGKGVNYFDRKEISSQDVTEEYVDIEARVRAKKVLEARYLALISKAKKVSEILEIEKELSAIREDIEAQEGRLRYMQNRVALSTVQIEFYKKTALEPGATVSYGSKMGNAIKSGFNGLSSFFIGLLYIWPFILIFVIAFFIIRKKLKKKKIS